MADEGAHTGEEGVYLWPWWGGSDILLMEREREGGEGEVTQATGRQGSGVNESPRG